MTIEERITACAQQFDELDAKRATLLQEASELLTEMTKLQGEYRVLQQIQADDKPSKVNKKATTVEAVAEGAN